MHFHFIRASSVSGQNQIDMYPVRFVKNNYKILIPLVTVIAISLIGSSSLPFPMPHGILQMSKAVAQDVNNTSSATSQAANSSTPLGKPIFTEHDKPTGVKLADVNGKRGLQVNYSGTGAVKGINFSANGTVLIVPSGDRTADFNGHAVIITPSEETGNYTFQSIGHVINGTMKDAIGNITANAGNFASSQPLRNMVTNELMRTNGTAVFHAASSGELSTINNLTVVFQEQIDMLGRSKIEGWESK